MSYKDISKKIKSISQEPEKIKAVFYGKAGTGKTTLAGSFPKPLLIDIKEKGQAVLKNVKGIKTMTVTEWSELDDLYFYLKKEDHGFKTLIIDTAGGAQMLAIEDVIKRKGKGKMKDKKAGDWGSMTQGMWGDVASMCKEMFFNLKDLDMHVVFIAHDKIFKAVDEEDDEGDIVRIAPHVGPALSPSVVSSLNAMVNTIGECFIGEREIVKKDPKTKKKTYERKINYYLRIGPNASYITKVRKPKENKIPDVIANPEFDDLIAFMK